MLYKLITYAITSSECRSHIKVRKRFSAQNVASSGSGTKGGNALQVWRWLKM
jgi:hypothetical protein